MEADLQVTDAVSNGGNVVAETASVALSPRRAAWKRFTNHRLALVAAIVLAAMILIAFVGPLIYTVDPNAVDPTQYQMPPNSAHPLGTDSAGRDVLARLVIGGRVSLLIGLSGALVATIFGVLLGAIAGYFRGWIDAGLSRLTEIVQSFPTLIVIITLAALIGPSVPLLIIAIGLMEWAGGFRVVRGLTMSLREQDSVQAVIGLGATSWRVVMKHIVPSVLGPATVVATLLVAAVIMLEAALSFLGLGVPQPTASWGNMLSGAQSLQILESMPWLWIPPGVAIAVTVLSVNFLGDGLRNAVDPKQGR